ncbi:MAG TPA: sigma-54-dependent Fis family transcriptional regulator [Candidatus Avidesulfovibrio excrementigallinarum]|nr:sigma-54-dependent Fis family transcriptional regulator [Candidatus Avidesulfovibrio excrementigallinarum]
MQTSPLLPFSDPLHAALGLALHLTPTPLNEAQLVLVSGQSADRVRQVLHVLRELGIAEEQQAGLWRGLNIPDEYLRRMAETAREKIPPNRMAHYLGYLLQQDTLENCEHVVRYLDGELNRQAPEVLFCLECVIQYLYHWGTTRQNEAAQQNSYYAELVLVVQSMSVFFNRQLQMAVRLSPLAYAMTGQYGNQRFRPLVAIFSCYLKVFSDENIPQYISSDVEKLNTLPALSDREMQDRLPLFKGILHHVRGEYPQVLDCYEQKQDSYDWKYRRFAILLTSCASQAAFYLQKYHLSLGINESLRRTAALDGDSMLSMFWMLHLAFAMLRTGDMDAAILNLDSLFMAFPLPQYNKTAAGTVRGIALYHYLNGRIRAAHAFLSRQAGLMVHQGTPHVPFEDPLNLDMLYAFEAEGLPPVQHYALDPLLETLTHCPNRQLRGAALRIKALRVRNQGQSAEREAALLRESRASLAGSGDPREAALTAYELANVLERLGDETSAAQLHKEVDAYAGRHIDRHMPYISVAVLLTCHIRNASGQPEQNRLESSLIARCSRAFCRLSGEISPENALHRLLSIAQMELKSERGVLFSTNTQGQLACESSINLTRMELDSEDMRPVMEWLTQRASETPPRCQCFGEQGLCLPLDIGRAHPWLLYLDSTFTDGIFTHLQAPDLYVLSCLFASEVRSALRLRQVRDEAFQHQKERFQSISLQENRNTAPIFGEGLGGLQEQIRHVSVTDAPVLILGETGVGKEVMARQIHAMSRRTGPFIAVHPASTSEHLFESEFFGHERGAFTGAVKQKLGFFEMADEGTLFIDEVGDIPPAIQTKLLRVIQEQRFTRVGGTREIYSSFRLIAATNKNLWEEVRKGTFREDLLYRISVVPLLLPPLRERRQDIMPLVQHFMLHFCRRYNRHPLFLTAEEVENLCHYDWPGNVRELKNVIERAVILNRYSMLDTEPREKARQVPVSPPSGQAFVVDDIPDLDELERRYLLHVQHISAGRIHGPHGMTERLHIKRSTLYAKLKKHGISLR